MESEKAERKAANDDLAGSSLAPLLLPQIYPFSDRYQTEPEHERKVRPLLWLTPGQAQVAWERAIAKAGGRKMTARLVKAAVQEHQPAGGAKPGCGEAFMVAELPQSD